MLYRTEYIYYIEQNTEHILYRTDYILDYILYRTDYICNIEQSTYAI